MTEEGYIESSTDLDWLLRALVGVVNGLERQDIHFGIPVTLNVSGFLVSGEMVGGKTYFEEFTQVFEAGFPEELSKGSAGSTAAPIRALGHVYEQEEFEDHPMVERFIHLRNAKYFHPSGSPIPANEGILWRGRLEAVDGFTLGTLTTDPGS